MIVGRIVFRGMPIVDFSRGSQKDFHGSNSGEI